MGLLGDIKDNLFPDEQDKADKAKSEAKDAADEAKKKADEAKQAQAEADKASGKTTPAQPTSAPAQPKAAPAPASSKTYTVKKGDTLSEIGQRFGVSWHKIAEVNNIENPDLIYPGQVFKIPS
ncbi:LysM peptidoglycan-binding domain-containing protein [Luteipulveratus halotolerans]|uniref:LysM peptidoglycan-binding domain-containing protein n=1 Tax=Luteipulveratus halotolerans TaxID=1631356 RepID=UPI00067FB9B5|nr:LysM domain-containing protein [Luteipulveratus halotolerans]